MRYWAFTIGEGGKPPPRGWIKEFGAETLFSDHKKPTGVAPGDRAVLYGEQTSGLLGAVEVTSERPEANESHETRRWPWLLRHTVLVAKAVDEHVAQPEDAGIDKHSLRGPHREIDQGQYDRAVV